MFNVCFLLVLIPEAVPNNYLPVRSISDSSSYQPDPARLDQENGPAGSAMASRGY